MRLLIILPAVSVFCLASLATTRSAEACSPINDIASAPASELAYDAANSPDAPVVVAAELYSSEDSGCGGAGSCGSLHGLRLELELDPATTLVRVDFADRPHVYAHVQDVFNGVTRIRLLGYEDVETLQLTITALDTNGYTSRPVDADATSDHGHGAGCSTSNGESTALLVLFATMLALIRRRSLAG